MTLAEQLLGGRVQNLWRARRHGPSPRGRARQGTLFNPDETKRPDDDPMDMPPLRHQIPEPR